MRRLGPDRRGSTAVEMALVLPVLMVMVLGAVDFAGAYSTRLELEQAAQRGIELAAAGKGVATSYDAARTEALAEWGKPVESATVDAWLECNGTRQGSLLGACAGGGVARYVAVVIRARYRPRFNLGGFFPSNGVVLTGDATVRVQ